MSCMDLLPSPPHEALRFPFDDDSRRDLDFHLDRLAEEHPDIAEPLKNFREDKHSKKKRTEDTPSASQNCTRGNCSDDSTKKESHKTEEPRNFNKEKLGLDTKLRYTVPDMRREQEEEQDRVSRSQSAPPSQQTPADNQPNLHGHQQAPPSREPVIRHIPIYVEGRDEPVIPKDFVDSPFPKEKRNLSRETSPIPPTRRSTPQEHHSWSQEHPTSVHMEHPQQAKHTSSVHINHSGSHSQPDRSVPIEIKINPQQPGHQTPRQTPQPQPQTHQPAKQPSQSKLACGPLEKVNAVQEEVSGLMDRVEQYSGANRQDKEYVFLDEMLTRNLLKLDDIETEGKEDVRAARKEAIRQIQRCISHLESKAPVPGNAPVNSQNTVISPEAEGQIEMQNSKDTQSDSTLTPSHPDNQVNEAQTLLSETQTAPS